MPMPGELTFRDPHTCKLSSVSPFPAPPTRISGGHGLIPTWWDPWGCETPMVVVWAPRLTCHCPSSARSINPQPRSPLRCARFQRTQHVHGCLASCGTLCTCFVCVASLWCAWEAIGGLFSPSRQGLDRVLFAQNGTFPTAQRLGHVGGSAVRVFAWLEGVLGVFG